MPAGFQSQHIYRKLLLAKLFCELLCLRLAAAAVHAESHTKSPHRRNTSSTGKQVVALHDLHDISLKQIKGHTIYRRNVDDHLAIFLCTFERIKSRLLKFLVILIFCGHPAPPPAFSYFDLIFLNKSLTFFILLS